ncbi:ankyrin repeat domain-containing protein [Nocardia wallacei]|uniref:ankyrin repeat domain-containing protein n=1 Tax=Nocardia wallacei TaxID=480035 RepID=UPI0024587777|nr:ankyrin repeat domain-containing protein [Nocardia wallacei]
MTRLDESGRTALHYAARDGEPTAVNRRLDTEDVTLTDHSRWTPLHFDSQAAVPEVVTQLLDAGTDLDASTEKGHPAMYWAAVTRMGSPQEQSACCEHEAPTPPGHDHRPVRPVPRQNCPRHPALHLAAAAAPKSLPNSRM